MGSMAGGYSRAALLSSEVNRRFATDVADNWRLRLDERHVVRLGEPVMVSLADRRVGQGSLSIAGTARGTGTGLYFRLKMPTPA